VIRLSVNVNKVATLRNSRGGTHPSVTRAVEVCLNAGAPGITVHPRADQRHIRSADVTDIVAIIARRRAATPGIELNIEGDPRPDLLDMVLAVRPDQCTLVPVVPGEVTSQAGWAPEAAGGLAAAVKRLKDAGIRVSVFVDAEAEAIRWAAGVGADRVELYTAPFARAFAKGGAAGRERFAGYVAAAEVAHAVGLGVNAGHDLDLENLTVFRGLPYLDEVSIGHALISQALWVGLDRAVREYLDVLAGH
jgi:pyridoxine 5-phosphate synthase